MDLNAGCLRVERYEALLKESSERIQLVQSYVITRGEKVRSRELATPLDHRDALPMSAVHNQDQADQVEHASVYLTETTLFSTSEY